MRNEHQAGWVPGLVTEANQDLLLETLMTAEQVFAGEQAHDSVALVVRGGEVEQLAALARALRPSCWPSATIPVVALHADACAR